LRDQALLIWLKESRHLLEQHNFAKGKYEDLVKGEAAIYREIQ